MVGAQAAPGRLRMHGVTLPCPALQGIPLEQQVAVHVGTWGAELLEQQRLVGSGCQRGAIGCRPAVIRVTSGSQLSMPAKQYVTEDNSHALLACSIMSRRHVAVTAGCACAGQQADGHWLQMSNRLQD